MCLVGISDHPIHRHLQVPGGISSLEQVIGIFDPLASVGLVPEGKPGNLIPALYKDRVRVGNIGTTASAIV